MALPSCIGTQRADLAPNAERTGSASSQAEVMSLTAMGRPLSMTAPITPWPFWNSVPRRSLAKPSSMPTRCLSPLARVMSA